MCDHWHEAASIDIKQCALLHMFHVNQTAGTFTYLMQNLSPLLQIQQCKQLRQSLAAQGKTAAQRAEDAKERDKICMELFTSGTPMRVLCISDLHVDQGGL